MAEIWRRASAHGTGFTLPESNSPIRRAISLFHSSSAPWSTVSSRLSRREPAKCGARLRRKRERLFQAGRKRQDSWRYFISKSSWRFTQLLRSLIKAQKCRFADPQPIAQSHHQAGMGFSSELGLHLLIGANEANAGRQTPIDSWKPAHRASGRTALRVLHRRAETLRADAAEANCVVSARYQNGGRSHDPAPR